MWLLQITKKLLTCALGTVTSFRHFFSLNALHANLFQIRVQKITSIYFGINEYSNIQPMSNLINENDMELKFGL